MIVLTQLVYVHPGKEDVFEAFERVALPLIAKYGGELLLRLRPTQDSVLASQIEVPYEIHLVRFDNEHDLARFTQDDERRRFLHLKEEAVRATWLIQGSLA
jgi:antibiotic biosynthesis monooxygenase (ABM) superfamily enzyme